MTAPMDSELLALATPYALHALDESERAEVERRVADAPPEIAGAFHNEVRGVRETMAVLSAATAVEPPATLRERVLGTAATERGLPSVAPLPTPRTVNWRNVGLAAAAVVVIGLGAVGVGFALRPGPTTAEQVFAAPDVQTVSGNIPVGGKATLVFSHDKHAGVLVMNDVPPPAPGTVYQMWLLGADGAHSAGTMSASNIAPSTTAVLPDIGNSKALAFTVEPGNGSTRPTTTPFAELPLS